MLKKMLVVTSQLYLRSEPITSKMGHWKMESMQVDQRKYKNLKAICLKNRKCTTEEAGVNICDCKKSPKGMKRQIMNALMNDLMNTEVTWYSGLKKQS